MKKTDNIVAGICHPRYFIRSLLHECQLPVTICIVSIVSSVNCEVIRVSRGGVPHRVERTKLQNHDVQFSKSAQVITTILTSVTNPHNHLLSQDLNFFTFSEDNGVRNSHYIGNSLKVQLVLSQSFDNTRSIDF